MIEFKLLLQSLSFVMVFALGQDTVLRSTVPRAAPAGHGSLHQLNLSRLEQRTDRQVHLLEQRLMQRLDAKLRARTNSSAASHLARLVTRLGDDLRASRASQSEQAATIRHLRQHVDRQRHDLRHMRADLHKLRATVANLTAPIKRLLLAGGGSGGVSGETVPTPDKPPSAPFKSLYPADCHDVIKNGMVYPGFYYISIQPYLSREPFKVCCQMTNESGWTLIQRRQDGSVNFFKNWYDYKMGFGNIQKEFWLGNDHIYAITNQGDYKLRIEMMDWKGHKYFAEYDHFRVSGEDDNFRLHVHGYHGDSGDSLTSHWENHNDQPFSTKDRDNDDRVYDNCAEHYHGAWWFKSCFESHLNGIYYKRGIHSNYFVRNGIQWNSIHMHSSLKYVAMMVKPNPKIKEAPFTDDEPNSV